MGKGTKSFMKIKSTYREKKQKNERTKRRSDSIGERLKGDKL